MRLHRMLLLLVAITSSACVVGSTEPSPAPSPATPEPAPSAAPSGVYSIDPILLGPLTGLGPCEPPPSPIGEQEVEGMVLPPGAILTTIEREDPLVNVQGYLEMTPIQIRVWYQRSGLEVLLIEDESIESEALVTDGETRTFLKSQAVCELGSIFIAVSAPEVAASVVPVPTGSARRSG